MNIALFDFDGTITNADMYTKFLHFSGTRRRALLAKIVLPPFFILYKVGVIPAPRMRTIASFVAFSGRKVDEVAAAGEEYAADVVPNHLREVALNKLKWHKNNGDQIVIVSASLDVYLKPWCAQNGFALVCSELEVDSGRFSGRYVNGDCSCANKPKLIGSKFELEQYEQIYAYGDTKEDLAMLSVADEAYLNWEPHPER
ncbi:haloacid dehalogenase-like hydrolase [Marinomonas spartinae]|uniref:Haloacid dehalogenase-like hydrolase n=1 Tax=Marinomonas spartinae TaxID=1792290 RepID=A0A1A8TPJ7_9GAMM|nr:HAD family hydrolase [Marinomonas spartinae]SBS34987.1 haloacid dehalogenase-like hydrolase [Marinomonas spartinae]